MNVLEFIIVIVILGAILYVAYYFLHGSSGKIALTRPVESRVDEYLDRKFQSLMDRHQLVTRPRLQRFREAQYRELERDEARLTSLRKAEPDMKSTLHDLEARVDTLEKDLAGKGEARR